MAGRRGLSDSGLRRLVRVMAEEVGQAQDYPLRRLMEEYLEAQSVEVAPEHSKQTRNRLDTLITWVEDRCSAEGLVPGTRVVLRSRADLVYLRAVLDSAEEILDGGPLEIEGGGDGE